MGTDCAATRNPRTCATAGSEWIARRTTPIETSRGRDPRRHFSPLYLISFSLFLNRPRLFPVLVWLPRQSLKQSLKVIVHTRLDLVDIALDSDAGAERVHEFHIFAAEGEMVIFELR